MNGIINIQKQDGQLVVSSRQIAEHFEKEHFHVLRDIENLIGGISKNGDTYNHLFIAAQYQNKQNKQWYKEYLLTRDGFSLLVMGFTGAKALQWKLRYIEAFNKMEQVLKEQPKQLTPMEQLRFQYQVIEEHEEKISKIEKTLERLEVNPSQRKAIQNARHKRVSEILGGKNSVAYKDKSFRAKVYAELGRAFNNYFDVPSYDCTPKNRFSEALELIEAYNLSAELNMELKKINNQIDV